MFECLLLIVDRDDFLQRKDGSKKGRTPLPRGGGSTPTLGQRLTDFLGTTFNLSLSLNKEHVEDGLCHGVLVQL